MRADRQVDAGGAVAAGEHGVAGQGVEGRVGDGADADLPRRAVGVFQAVVAGVAAADAAREALESGGDGTAKGQRDRAAGVAGDLLDAVGILECHAVAPRLIEG